MTFLLLTTSIIEDMLVDNIVHEHISCYNNLCNLEGVNRAIEEVIQKFMNGLTPQDVTITIDADYGNDMQNLVDTMGQLAFRWWSTPDEKDIKIIHDVQSKLAASQIILLPKC